MEGVKAKIFVEDEAAHLRRLFTEEQAKVVWESVRPKVNKKVNS